MKTNFNFTIGNANLTIDNTPISLENITINYDGELNAQELSTTFGQLKEFFKMAKDAAEVRAHKRKEIVRTPDPEPTPQPEPKKITVHTTTPEPEPEKDYGERFKKNISILTDLGFKRTKRNYFEYAVSESEDNPILIKAYISSFGWCSVTLETRYTHTDIFDVTKEEGRIDYAYDIPEDIPEEDKIKIDTILKKMKNIK